jgi:hypothetical protein
VKTPENAGQVQKLMCESLDMLLSRFPRGTAHVTLYLRLVDDAAGGDPDDTSAGMILTSEASAQEAHRLMGEGMSKPNACTGYMLNGVEVPKQ